ncbi:PAS domain-containing sensor histidine kinase [Candidatus Parcubacteria bacterium]|nr:PAS domain-containing sensor histidine kinase [Candidatus Parcubacteria bacterium]
MEEQRRFAILAAVQAGVGGLTALGVAALYLLAPATLQNSGFAQVMAALGLVTALYYLSGHQFLKRRYLRASLLVLSGLSGVNLLIVLASTGGLDSPFYGFWLLVIAASGLFGATPPAVALGATGLGAGLAWWGQGLSLQYLSAHAGQALVTIAAWGLAQWINLGARRTKQDKQAVSALSGELGAERLRAQVLMSSIADGVIVIDRSNQIQLLNRAAQEMTGWDAESVQNVDYHLVLPLTAADGKPLAPADDPFQQSWAANASIVRNDLVMTTSGGNQRTLSISVSPIYNGDQSIAGAIAVFRDISKDKEVERQRSEFVSTASHEMRTPVAAIEGYISLALNPKVATVDDRAKEYLNKAHQNTQHLGELFRDLLSVTKVEQGQLARNLAPVNLGQLVEDVVRDMQFSAEKKKLTLTFAPAGAGLGGDKTVMPLYYVRADQERIREVLMNLVDNALKYTPEGGVTVGIVGDERTVNVSVRDTGPGISPENIPHLFQKFYRVDSSATRTIGGTGLGLYLCRAVIELHGGRIWAESTPGQGSTFYFNLPRLPASQAEPTPAATVAPAQPVATPAVNPAAPVPAAAPAPAQPTAGPAQPAAAAAYIAPAIPPGGGK